MIGFGMPLLIGLCLPKDDITRSRFLAFPSMRSSGGGVHGRRPLVDGFCALPGLPGPRHLRSRAGEHRRDDEA